MDLAPPEDKVLIHDDDVQVAHTYNVCHKNLKEIPLQSMALGITSDFEDANTFLKAKAIDSNGVEAQVRKKD